MLVLYSGCLCQIPWSQMLSREWRCSWSSADRRCSNYIWVTDNFIAYQGAAYVRGFTVGLFRNSLPVLMMCCIKLLVHSACITSWLAPSPFIGNKSPPEMCWEEMTRHMMPWRSDLPLGRYSAKRPMFNSWSSKVIRISQTRVKWTPISDVLWQSLFKCYLKLFW